MPCPLGYDRCVVGAHPRLDRRVENCLVPGGEPLLPRVAARGEVECRDPVLDQLPQQMHENELSGRMRRMKRRIDENARVDGACASDEAIMRTDELAAARERHGMDELRVRRHQPAVKVAFQIVGGKGQNAMRRAVPKIAHVDQCIEMAIECCKIAKPLETQLAELL